jgi:hypothetical protein
MCMACRKYGPIQSFCVSKHGNMWQIKAGIIDPSHVSFCEIQV